MANHLVWWIYCVDASAQLLVWPVHTQPHTMTASHVSMSGMCRSSSRCFGGTAATSSRYRHIQSTTHMKCCGTSHHIVSLQSVMHWCMSSAAVFLIARAFSSHRFYVPGQNKCVQMRTRLQYTLCATTLCASFESG